MCRPFQRDRQHLHAVLPILFYHILLLYHRFCRFSRAKQQFFSKRCTKQRCRNCGKRRNTPLCGIASGLFRTGNSAAAHNGFAVIENDSLPAGDRPLRLVEFHMEYAVRCAPCRGRLFRMAVADLRLYANRLFQTVAGDQVHVGGGQPAGKQVLTAAQRDGVLFRTDAADIQRMRGRNAQPCPMV